ncbi:MAG TPA: PfkB family carbohydrate kinase [Tepidisphaeraceae bacterium]|nr:PfkB family carbohydrate kinase [Tepidisphaeraceae bacterium]
MAHRRGTASHPRPVVIGTGLVALDVVIADDAAAEPLLCAGGTCGNVLTALAFRGWDAYPVARLRADAASKRVLDDLTHWGVKLDFVTVSDIGSTPVVVQHIRENGNGERSHKFSRRCPTCGNWLPWYKAVKAAAIPDLSPRLPKAHVFYFDRTSRGAVTLAEHARDAGAVVVFEPSAESDPSLLDDALATAHVVKVAADRLRGNGSVLRAQRPTLLIETLGAKGLRYSAKARAGKRVWKTLSAFPVNELRDSAGAGDWCTAGIISRLGQLGVDGLATASAQTLEDAIRLGQAMAAWTCRYDGPRGGMYAVTPEEFDHAITAILKGKNAAAAARRPSNVSGLRQRGVWCHCCLTGAS